MLNRVVSPEIPRATTVVHTQEYPITLLMVGSGQLSRLNAGCLPIGSCLGQYVFKSVVSEEYLLYCILEHVFHYPHNYTIIIIIRYE